MAVKQRLDKLKEVAYDMEDVLDEWNTARLKLQIEGGVSASKQSKRVFSFITSSSCFRCREIGLRRDIAQKIKDLNETMNDIKIQKDMFNLEVGKGTITQPAGRITISSIDTTEVRSREQEKKRIKNLLLSESTHGSTIHTVSIVGMGGIGKTTLAQLAFNDHEVKAYFDKTIWVSVSKPFDASMVAKAILESFSDDAQRFGVLQNIVTRIEEVITRKKFLLVLDDVWEDGPDKWGQLKHSLLGGSRGSKILVTTRREIVASNMGCTSDKLCHIRKLSSEDCWSIFSHVAFFERDKEECKRLETIGRQIVDKCDCLPLAAKALGSVLRFKSSVEEWSKVLHSELRELPRIWEAQTGLASLWLSYYDLPSELRQCFSYCAIFPEDHLFEEEKLIAMWMAQGYLRTTSITIDAMETYGEECFQSLTRRCFFQKFNGYDTYKMHDVLSDFALYLTKEECFSLEINNSEELTEPSTLPIKVRHLRIALGEEASIPCSISKLEKLRTFWLHLHPFGATINVTALSTLLDNLTCLRSLFLSACAITQIPPSISKLIHLRQLDLSFNHELDKLPETVCELHHLQTLDITACYKTDLPGSMEKLINLRHLHNFSSGSSIPKGVLRLNNLMTLGEFTVSGASETKCTLGDLKTWRKLKGVDIKGLENVGEEEAKEVQLNKMNQIIGWLLFFGNEETEERKRHDEELIETLEPSPNTEILGISGYQGTKFSPKWLMSLNNMRKLTLECINCEYVPPLWKPPALEELQLDCMRGVKRLGVGFVGMETQTDMEISSSASMVAFPKLKRLRLYGLENWEEWESDAR